MSALLAIFARNPVASGLGAAALVLLLAVGAQTVRLRLTASELEAVQAQHQSEARRAMNALAQLETVTAGLRQAEAINGNQAAALARQTTAIAALRDEADRREKAAAERERDVLAQLAVARQKDGARRARPGLPPPDEMTDVLREAVGAL